VAEGLLKADEVKIPKVGKRKVYSIAVAEVVIEGDED
jgi:hypothetical protein